jgi:virulence-associated protein VapD
MSTQLSAQDLFDISKAFHDISTTLGEFRYSNWNALTSSQRTDLEAKQWTLFNTSSDLNAKSVVLKVKLLDTELQTLKSCIADMKAAKQKIADIKHAIAIATKAVAFGGTIYLAASTGDVAAMIGAATSLIQAINA